ncbi:hypothetical protein HPB51_010357 [Rhipicephalus microplus]|uniref:Tc1-like transposase DDE domain-containing protein n=1 Tax=Rhipicephalus microplus TaxID=6941 RepID=A0A9J6DU95_RHIMP|nr:hypothetical protein HPB51_010357 [Rhipicephalus microplus]
MSPRVPADGRRRIVELSIQGFFQRVICRFFQSSRNAEWPPVGEDLNPIENVWGLVKRRLSAWNLGSSTKETLFAAIQEEWEALRSRPEIVAAL